MIRPSNGEEELGEMINQVTLVGRLTKDPELRVTPEGTSVVNLTLAVNRQFKNQNGEYETDFVHCTIWRKTAENTANFCKKGSVIGITGKIHTRNYQNQEGKRVYVTEVVAESVQFLSRRPEVQISPSDQRSAVEWKAPGERRGNTEEWLPTNNQNSSKVWVDEGHKEKGEVNATATATAGGIR